MEKHHNLINQLQQKNQMAFSQLYDEYAGAIFGVILRICKSEELSQEVLQDTFLTVWEKANTYDSTKARFYTWLHRIAKNKALNAVRKKSIFIQTNDFGVYEEKQDLDEEESKEAKPLVGLNDLETQHQRAIELVYFEGYTHKEAHQIMRVPLGTFKSYVRQALGKLKKKNLILNLMVMILIFLGK